MKQAALKMGPPDRIASYFRLQAPTVALITCTGALYNVGMTAGPYFEGQLAQRLLDVMQGACTWADMARLAALYVAVIGLVQGLRCIKRFGVRHFANHTARAMRRVLYNNLVREGKAAMEQEDMGAWMTKALADVDACAEGMRKFTTELFDTGVVMLAYLAMLLWYDWRLTLLACLFTPAAYAIAGWLKGRVTQSSGAYKRSGEQLNRATLDRVSNGLLYRVYGREEGRDQAYEQRLQDYEKKAVAANLWENTMEPLYHIIVMSGVVLILYWGGRNVTGQGWSRWDLAAFTTFLACFAKLAAKSSKAARLFNAVQKAQVSWQRIRPRLGAVVHNPPPPAEEAGRELVVDHLSFAYPGGSPVLRDVSFRAKPGQIVGITGPVAAGKSTLGKAFLCERPYGGSIRLGGRELAEMTPGQRCASVGYLGHRPELMSDTIGENIRLGQPGDIGPSLAAAQLDREVAAMPLGEETPVGSQGVRLSGGQQARLALARTLYQSRPLVVLDDPFSAVDRQTEGKMLAALRQWGRGRVILLISHRLDRFPQLDQVVWLADGASDAGTHAELMERQPLYRQLFLQQQQGGDLDEA